jgi:hypothetical protein
MAKTMTIIESPTGIIIMAGWRVKRVIISLASFVEN